MKRLYSKLLLALFLTTIGCSVDQPNENIQPLTDSYDDLMLGISSINSIKQMANLDDSFEASRISIENRLKKFETSKSGESAVPEFYQKEIVSFRKEDLSDVYSSNQKEFIIKFFNKLSNEKDGLILDVV